VTYYHYIISWRSTFSTVLGV